MADQVLNHNRKYLYAVVAGIEKQNYESGGIDNGTLYNISEGKISAVVSDVPKKKLRPERRHLAANQGALKRLMEKSTPAPMSFGIIADGPNGIQKILSLNQEVFFVDIDLKE